MHSQLLLTIDLLDSNVHVLLPLLGSLRPLPGKAA